MARTKLCCYDGRMYSLTIDTQGIWRPLRAGDRVDVVAPSRSGKPGELELVPQFLASWGLEAHIPDNLLGEDLLCANSDELRLKFLTEALNDSQAAAVWCWRGGYGCSRLMPQFTELPIPKNLPWFIGFSDITLLHSWINQAWHWPSLHGPSLRQLIASEVDELTVKLLKGILFGTEPVLQYTDLVLLNDQVQDISALIMGGNLCLLENSIGTSWEFNVENKILLLEEVNEVAYRVDRSLNHLIHAGLTQKAAAIILGDFTHIDPQQERLIDRILQLFANQAQCPVYRLRGVGHGARNLPIPLGVKADISSKLV